jgi:hypothetical protein
MGRNQHIYRLPNKPQQSHLCGCLDVTWKQYSEAHRLDEQYARPIVGRNSRRKSHRNNFKRYAVNRPTTRSTTVPRQGPSIWTLALQEFTHDKALHNGADSTRMIKVFMTNNNGRQLPDTLLMQVRCDNLRASIETLGIGWPGVV